MIKIVQKEACCGCNACRQICPKQCISICEDLEGFLYPKVDFDICIDCHLCEKVCPILQQREPHKSLKTCAVKNMDDEVRMASSSGGVFTLLASAIIEKGGVVFGAKFNDKWEVVHDYTETKEGVVVFCGSKYVQSYIGDCFKQARNFLEDGRKVLFSGTPCQIAGLKLFLRKEYENLSTVDFICHGVPSPKVWRMYLHEIIARQSRKNVIIEAISFRDKCLGWKNFSFTLTLSKAKESGLKEIILFTEVFSKNMFMKGFLSNLYLRPSCHFCPSKCFKSGSDITLGDFWGSEKILPLFDDNKGVSVVIINSNNGNSCIESIEKMLTLRQIHLEDVIYYNWCLKKSVAPHINRDKFFVDCDKSVLLALEKQFKRPLIHKVIFKVISIGKQIIGK